MSAPALAAGAIERAAEVRAEVGRRFFASEAERLARLCRLMAERFAAGGRLIALGYAGAARSDARHVAVEFVHPVIVGKRALPALALCAEGGELAGRLALLAREQDTVLAFGGADGGQAERALSVARARGCLTVSFAASGAQHELWPPEGDPLVAQEIVETLYHVLWELVHVFLEHRGLRAGPGPDPGASGFLYPFLSEPAPDVGAVLEDVRRSVVAKSEDIAALRIRTLHENADVLRAAAAALRHSAGRGGTVLALGNGGSATDAMDSTADLLARGIPALDLTEDTGILTAVANDVGVEAIFSRQVIAFGRAGDVLLAFSTSGGSANVIAALAEARRTGMVTVAMVGYDGGRILAEQLADHVIVAPSEHIPRIQEAQASALHVLLELAG